MIVRCCLSVLVTELTLVTFSNQNQNIFSRNSCHVYSSGHHVRSKLLVRVPGIYDLVCLLEMQGDGRYFISVDNLLARDSQPDRPL